MKGVMVPMRKCSVLAALAALGSMAGTSAMASLIVTGTGTPNGDSYQVTAQATFTALAGNELQIKLANIGSTATEDIGGLLYGVSFSGAAGTLSLQSASISAGETEWNEATPTAITSTLNVMSPATHDPGWILTGNDVTSLQGGNQSDGLLSESYTGNDLDGLSQTGHNPAFEDFVTLVLSGYTGGDAGLTSINDVIFGIGTSSDTITATSYVISTPEPSTIFAGALLLLPFGAGVLRSYRKSSKA